MHALGGIGSCRLWWVVCLVLAVVAASAADPRHYRVEETVLGEVTIDPYDLSRWLQASPDGSRAALLIADGEGQRLAVDGQMPQGRPYDAVWGFVFSADSRRCAYVGRRDGRWYAVVDGVEGPPYDEIGMPPYQVPGAQTHGGAMPGIVMPGPPRERRGAPTFSPDGSRVGYVARRGARWVAVVDGQEGPQYDQIGCSPPNIGFPTAPADGEPPGVPGAEPPPPFVTLPRAPDGVVVFSADGSRVGYVARAGARWTAVLDGQAGTPWDQIDTPVAFSADATHFTYYARGGDDSFMVYDGERVPRDGPSPIFSPHGRRVIYQIWRGEPAGSHRGTCLVVDGRSTPEYDTISNVIFSPDNRHIAYTATRLEGATPQTAGRQYVAIDGAAYAYDAVAAPQFSPDSKWLCYVVGEGTAKRAVVADSGGAPPHEGPPYDGVGFVCHGAGFSPDGSRVGYIARKGRTSVAVVDGREEASYDDVLGFTWSADGKHYAYCGVRGTGEPARGDLVVDGVARGTCPARPGIVLSADGSRWCHTVWTEGAPASTVVVVANGQASPNWQIIWRGPAYSPDGRRLAYLAQTERGANVLVVDGHRWPVGVRSGEFAFSPGGHVVVHAPYDGSVLVEGEKGPAYDAIIHPAPQFHPDGTVEYLAVRALGREACRLVRVKHVPAGE